MSGQVTELRSAGGSYLCTVAYYRMPDGTIRASLQDMPAHVIEAEPTITARFFAAAQWSLSGMLDLMRQGVRFDEEHRTSVNDDPSPEAQP